MKKIIGIILIVLGLAGMIYEFSEFPLEGTIGAIFTIACVISFIIGILLLITKNNKDLFTAIITMIVDFFTIG